MRGRQEQMTRTMNAAAALTAVLLLAGCATAAPGEAPSSSATTSSPMPSGAPASATATPGSGATDEPANGCSNGGGAVPAGAATATIPDVDGDDEPDTEFFAEAPGPFTYGIRTSAGGVATLRDDLAGPGVHSGWTAAIDGPVGHVTVLDDGRTATLHAWVGCRFVTPVGTDGRPYRFGLNGFSEYGTGVACVPTGAGRSLAGVLARRADDGRYDIELTTVEVSADGTRATNGPTETRWTGLAASDPRVRAAMRSSCDGVPEVRTSGR